LYVLPAHQRQGIGRRLLAAVIDGFPASGKVWLIVEAQNLKGISFYRREGFRITGQAIEEGIRHFEMQKELR
jgi:ribosomal protein S18 acetylase RimI-like enzyme